MPSLQVLVNAGHRKVQTNAMIVCKSLVKQRRYILPHYQLGHVSPGHAPVVGMCLHVRRRAVVVVFLLLLLSGDVETNPGPVGEVLRLTVSDVSPAEPDSHTKSFFCVRL